MNNLDELKRTLEEIRSEKYNYIPKELIEGIIDIEQKYAEDSVRAAKEVQNLIDSYLKGAVK